MADISVSDIEKAIKDILKGADLSSLSTKKVRKTLEEKFETDFTSRKKEIDKMVMRLITENEDEEKRKEEEKKKGNEQSDEEEEEEETNGATEENENDGLSESEEEETPAKKAPSKPSKPAEKGGKRKSASKADDSEDPVMSSIKHLGDEDLAKRLQEEESGLRTRGARRAAAAPPKPKKRKEQDPDKKRKPAAPCRLSEELAAVVGKDEMPRTEVVKILWSIVKERNLQDPENKQFIVCDEQLSKLFGQKRIRAFGMTKYLKRHVKTMDN